MAEPKANPQVSAGGGTMIASASANVPSSSPPPPPPRGGMGGKGTMVASAPPPVAKAPAAAPQPVDDLGSGGTMISIADAPKIGGTALEGLSPASVTAVQDLIGTVLLGRYRVIKKLGEGGMGTVYLGEHATIGKKFAVKVLSHEFAHKDDLRERFLQEARAASMISQENVVEITDFGDTPDGSVFFIMEFLNGEDLSDTVKTHGRLPWPRVKHIMLQVCRALAAAHDAGIIHRDMKPENCYRITRGTNEDFIKVLDFGIAKVTSEEDGEGKGLTRTGMIFGTPEYMSPEQAQGAKPDHRVDVYALGVILYELLTGRVPFSADTFMGILTKHMFEVPEAPSAVVPEAEIPAEVEAIILKAMQKDRELRFADMREMAAAIEAVGTGAAAVAFVNENIARPSTGEMAFTGSRATAMPGTIPPVSAIAEEPGKSNKGLIFGLVGGLVLAAAGVGAFIAFGGDKGDTLAQTDPEPATVAKAPEPDAPEQPVVPAVEEPEKVKEIAVGTETVTYHIMTSDAEGNPVIASILDPRDNGSYGKTNTPEGVDVEKSTDPLALVLRASGFDEQPIEIVPDSDKKFEYVMKPIPKAAPPKKTVSSKTKKVEPKPEDKPTPKEEAKTKPPRRVSPDLKDPFGSRGG